MAGKILGLGTLIDSDDFQDSSGGVSLHLVINATPPPREREKIDGTALADTLSTNEPGIEMHSEFVFTHYWEPGDDQHEAIDDLFDSKERFSLTITYTTATPVTDTFQCWISKVAAQTIEKDKLLTRDVTCQRTSAINRS